MMPASPAESLRTPPADPSELVLECMFCGGLAFGVTQGKWSADGRAYTEVLFLCAAQPCPAVDPAARSARPALLTTAPPKRRRWLFSRGRAS